jgi:hypothetical protein
LVIAIGGQRGEHALPDAGMAPAAEALVHSLPFATAPAGRTNARLTARPTNIRSRTGGYPRPCVGSQQWRNLPPLRLAQLISLRRHHPLRVESRSSMNQRANPLGILNVDPS